MIRPFRIFVLLALILFILYIPILFFPSEGLMIGSIKLRYPTGNKIFGIDSSQSAPLELKPEIAYLDKFLQSTNFLYPPKDSLISLLTAVDTIPKPDTTKITDTLPKNQFSVEWLKSKILKLEFPDSTQSSLNSFFRALQSGECSRTLVRVMHYGDSQIEGDRVTSYLRSRLQRQFGGKGVGLIHAVPPSYQPTAISQSVSSNWEKVTLADHDKISSGINRYGAIGGYSTFKPTQDLFSKSTDEAWIKIQRIGNVNVSARGFDRFKLFFGYNSEPFLVELNTNGKVIEADLLPASKSLSQLTWGIDEMVNSFEIKFKGDSSPIIFGLSLETEKGIEVDNIPIRGSSGTDFTRTDMTFMQDMFKMLNTRLIILQFGVNVVPKPQDNYKYYEVQFYKQIKAIQTAKPDASIVIIGVSDVSRKEGSDFVSYPNIELIRDAQKNAARKAGVPFWDCYKAMGGQNSMAAWTFAKPPLANKDFIHFTTRGANLIAEMFYSALMSEYDKYLNSNGMQSNSTVSNRIKSHQISTQTIHHKTN